MGKVNNNLRYAATAVTAALGIAAAAASGVAMAYGSKAIQQIGQLGLLGGALAVPFSAVPLLFVDQSQEGN